MSDRSQGRSESEGRLGAQHTNVELLLRAGHDLAVAGMIGSFHADNLFADLRPLFTQILGKRGLGTGGAIQDYAGIAHGVRDALHHFLVFVNVAAAHRIGLVMDMTGLQVRMLVDLIGFGETNVEHLGLLVVDPDDG